MVRKGACVRERQTYLFVRHAPESDFQHVQVIPSTWTPPVRIGRDPVQDEENRALMTGTDAQGVTYVVAAAQWVWSSEGVVDVAGHAPGVGN